MANAYFYFHTAEDSTGNGEVYENKKAMYPNSTVHYANEKALYTSGGETMTLEFAVTGTFAAGVEVSNDGTAWYDHGLVVDMTAGDVATSISDATHVYSLDIKGFRYIRVPLSANTGEVTCKGWVV